MAWKPKEKELTPEQAIEQAKKELFRYWHNSSPLFAGIRHGSAVTIHPLDAEFAPKPWVIVFLDPTTIVGEYILSYITELNRRFNSFGIGFLAVFKPTYDFLKEKHILERLCEGHKIGFPVTVDAEGMIRTGFNVSGLPHALFFHKSRAILSEAGTGWLDTLEPAIHRFLRENDPGLPLWPFHSPGETLLRDGLTLEFGKGRGTNLRMIPPEASGSELGFSRDPKEILVIGDWDQGPDSLLTKDPHAKLMFQSRYPYLGVVAASQTRMLEYAKAVFETNDMPVVDAFSSKDLKYDEHGQSYLEVRDGQLYHAIKDLPHDLRGVTISFPTAKSVPVQIYGIRFGEPAPEQPGHHLV